jgi:hypothetical protein
MYQRRRRWGQEKFRNCSSFPNKFGDLDQSSINFIEVRSMEESHHEPPTLKTVFGIYSLGELFLTELP